MSLKKIFSVVLLCAVFTTGTFAKNHALGMDIAVGVLGFDTTKFKVGGVENSYNVIDILPIKINTYDCFLLNDHLGVYASLGLLPGVQFNNKTTVNGVTEKSDDIWANVGMEFMIGPAFGIDLGESSVRFQIGAPFHFMGGVAMLDRTRVVSNTRGGRIYMVETTYKESIEYFTFGLGLTPQFRFMADRRFSLVVGMDFVFDFLYSCTYKTEVLGVTSSRKYEPDSAFRFYWTPYAGLGINF